jgi:glycosyltransferase involved in cell wall biosynthesis
MSDRLPVSVVIPAYNRAAPLRRALESVIAQTPWRPAEIVVADDASMDDTAAVAAALGARVIVHEHNRGAAAARNTAIAAATQPWLAFLDSDDEWLPHHLSTLWWRRSGHVLVAGAAVAVGGGARARYLGPLTRAPHVLASPAELYPENFLPASAVLARRDAVLAAGGYDTTLRHAEDLDLWIRLMDHGTAVACPDVVARYRRHDGQKSLDDARSRPAQLRIVQAYRDRPWWTARLVDRQLAFRAWDALRGALRRGDRAAALREARALAWPPTRTVALARLLTRRCRVRRRSARLHPDLLGLQTGAP